MNTQKLLHEGAQLSAAVMAYEMAKDNMDKTRQKRNEEIKKLHKKGWVLRDIAKIAGVNFSSVALIVRGEIN